MSSQTSVVEDFDYHNLFAPTDNVISLSGTEPSLHTAAAESWSTKGRLREFRKNDSINLDIEMARSAPTQFDTGVFTFYFTLIEHTAAHEGEQPVFISGKLNDFTLTFDTKRTVDLLGLPVALFLGQDAHTKFTRTIAAFSLTQAVSFVKTKLPTLSLNIQFKVVPNIFTKSDTWITVTMLGYVAASRLFLFPTLVPGEKEEEEEWSLVDLFQQ